MKFSVSTYSLSGLVGKNGVEEKDLIRIAKEIGFDGIEFAEINTPEGKDKKEYDKALKELNEFYRVSKSWIGHPTFWRLS